MGRSIAKLFAARNSGSATPAQDAQLNPESTAPVEPVAARLLRGLRGPREVHRYGFLIGATLALFAGIFLLWQIWLVCGEQRAIARVEDVRDWEVRTLGKFIADTRARVQLAVADPAVTAPLALGDEGRVEAAAALKHALPDLISVEFYHADIDDVLHSDFAKFGYSRASLLVQAYQLQAMGPTQSAPDNGKPRNLVFTLPVMSDGKTVAYAYVALPFTPLVAAFRQRELSSARADLRQGTGNGDLVLASIGNLGAGSTLNSPGVAVPGSSFRIGTAPPQQLIFLPRSLWLLIPLLLLAIFGTAAMFYARTMGWRAALEHLLRPRAKTADARVVAQTVEPAKKVSAIAEPDAGAAK